MNEALNNVLRPKEVGGNGYEPISKYLVVKSDDEEKSGGFIKKTIVNKLGQKKTIFIKKDDPCWDGYEQVGMKMKNGKKVPNCVRKTKK